MTGRYTTSGHLTSLGIRVGAGVGPVKAELFCLGFFHSHRWCRRMEEVEMAGAECDVCLPITSAGSDCGARTSVEPSERFLSQEAQSSSGCEKQGLMGDLLSGSRVKEGC